MRPILFLCMLLFVTTAKSASSDSLVRLNDLSFKNEQEKKAFQSFQLKGDKSDVIDLFMTHFSKTESKYLQTAHAQIKSAVDELIRETSGYSDQKKIKYIYKYIHHRFFKMYELENSFSDIFESGVYNCVSGSAMYSIVLQAMHIPYQVVEAPQHVFLFAYPQTHRIIIESTSPKNGYITYNEWYVQRFLNHLVESKIISKDEYEATHATELFNKYYFSENGLTIQDLASIQYSNYAYYYAEKKQGEKALEEAKKAYYLSPTERSAYILQAALTDVVSNISYKEKRDFNNLVLLCRLNQADKNNISNEFIRNEFTRLTYQQLISASNKDQYQFAFNLILNEIKDSLLKNELIFMYHYALARQDYTNISVKNTEIQHLKTAYDINPKHTDLRLMIRAFFGRLIETYTEPSIIMKEVVLFENNFNFLSTDEYFSRVKLNCYLDLAYQAFMLQDVTTGETELSIFETIYSKNDSIKVSEYYVEKAYSTAATYYFKKGNKTKTREVLKRGIKYAPENFGLRIRLSQVK
jgi:hypothetical protein